MAAREGRRKSWQEDVSLNLSGDGAAAAPAGDKPVEHPLSKSVAVSEVSVAKQEIEWKGADDLSDSDGDYDDEMQEVIGSLRMQKRSSWQEIAGLPLQGSAVFVKTVPLSQMDTDWNGISDMHDEEEMSPAKRRGSWQELAGLPLQGSAVYVKEVQCQQFETEWALGDDVSTDEEGGEDGDRVPTVPFKRGSLLETPVDLSALIPAPEGAAATRRAPSPEAAGAVQPAGRRKSWQADIPLIGLSGGADGVEVKEVQAITADKEWSAGIDSDDDDEAIQMKLATWQEQTGLPLRGSGVYVKMVQLSEEMQEWTGAAGIAEDDDDEADGAEAPKRRASWQELAGIPLQGTGVYLKPVDLKEENGEWGGDPEDSDKEDAPPVVPFKRGSLLETPVDFQVKAIDTSAAQGDAGPAAEKRKSWQAEGENAVAHHEVGVLTMDKEPQFAAGDLSDTSDSDEEGPAEAGEDASKGKKRQSWQELAALPLQGGAVCPKKADVIQSEKEWGGAGDMDDEEDDVVLNRRKSWQEEAGLPLSGTGVFVKPVAQVEVDQEWKGGGDESGSDDEGANRRRGSWQEAAGLPLRGSAVFPKEVQLEKVEKDWDGAANVSDSEDEGKGSEPTAAAASAAPKAEDAKSFDPPPRT